MRGRLISMLLMFVILFGSIVAPETTHADALMGGHGTEVVNFNDHADASNQSDESEKSGIPCHALVHHHCTIAISPDPGVGSPLEWSAKTAVMPVSVRALASLAMAPPTEPPAA